MATLEKLKSGKWRAKVFLGKNSEGKSTFKSFTAPTKKEAEKLANQYLVDYQRGLKKQKDPSRNLTLGEAMRAYIDAKRETLSSSTIAGYEKIMRNDFLDIQGYRLCDLSNDRIQMSLNSSANRKPNCENCKTGLSKKSLKNANGFLRSVLTRYYPEFHYQVDIPRGHVNEHDNVIHDAETIIRVVKGSNVELAVWLGMMSFRMSEVLGFRKCDCDLEDGYITVNQTVVYSDHCEKEIRSYGKTEKSMRTVKLPQYVVELIKALPDNQEYLVQESDQTVSKRFYRLLEKNGLTHMRFHDLRHLHASITQSLGIDDKIRQQIGGWSNPIIMNKTYTMIFDKDRAEADSKIVNYFDLLAKKSVI